MQEHLFFNKKGQEKTVARLERITRQFTMHIEELRGCMAAMDRREIGTNTKQLSISITNCCKAASLECDHIESIRPDY